MILVLEIDRDAVAPAVAAVPDGSVAWGGEFSSLELAAAAIRAELERRRAPDAPARGADGIDA